MSRTDVENRLRFAQPIGDLAETVDAPFEDVEQIFARRIEKHAFTLAIAGERVNLAAGQVVNGRPGASHHLEM